MSPPVQPPGSPSGTFVRRVPEGDNRERLVCGNCGFVQYENPKVVVGAVCSWEDRILLCRRAINPRKGFWTLPAGYLELHETTADGALREAWEEARAKIEIEGVLAVYTITRLSPGAGHLPRPPGLARCLGRPGERRGRAVPWDEIPWPEIAFPSVRWALSHYREAIDRGEFGHRSNPAGEFGGLLRGLSALSICQPRRKKQSLADSLIADD